MEFVSFESEMESNKMLEMCVKNEHLFGDHTFVGAITVNAGTLTDWYWANSGNPLNHKIKFAPGEPNNHRGEEYCMSITHLRGTLDIFYNDISCTSDMNPFICQKIMF